ncbi:MAG: hypothetical protein JMN24_18845 [gamma proteobacterium endosymbiont of Lamellibrachia anaximandri]|nr:hypothetical protein [gamma proteobacterium endosymbiont of Lamellibrachia anaximandri]MBL3619708.1 hypothetical protein [gamma proteobacterium endosymbiont of Lamellibrachia anaximandri]
MTQLAIVQTAPVFLDKIKTIELAVIKVEEAASQGAELIVFTEAFIPGYPAWVWRLRPGGDWNLSEALHARLLGNAVNMESDDLSPLYQVAKKYQLTIVCGIEERESQLGRATLYNTVMALQENLWVEI